MTFRHLVAPLTLAVLFVAGGAALAQGTLSGQIDTASDPAFPAVNGSVPAATVGAPSAKSFLRNGAPPVGSVPSASLELLCHTFQCALARAGGFSGAQAEQCAKEFTPLREDAEQSGKLIREAGARHAAPSELIGNFAEDEIKMIRYVQSHASCWIPRNVSDDLRVGHKNTEALRTRVCAVAQQVQQRGSAGPVGDFPPVLRPLNEMT
jgi:hypothetical protein